MRFFSGIRSDNDATRKKGLAGALYKQKLLGKSPAEEPTQQEKYRSLLDKKMDDVMNELAREKKKAFQLPGTKVDEKKEVSKNFKALLNQLAMKKLQKDMNQKKKKERALALAEKEKKRAQENAILAEKNKKLLLEKQEMERKRQQENGSSSYFFGPVEDEKKWWW